MYKMASLSVFDEGIMSVTVQPSVVLVGFLWLLLSFFFVCFWRVKLNEYYQYAEFDIYHI